MSAQDGARCVMENIKDLILDTETHAALSSIMKLTGKDEATCIRLALTFFAKALICHRRSKRKGKPEARRNRFPGDTDVVGFCTNG